MSKKVLIFALLAIFSQAANVFTQVTTGNLQGVVRDQNGGSIAGAQVRITNTETGVSRQSVTNEDGFYRVTNLLPGDNYTVEVTASGFAAAKAEKVAIRLAAENSADIVVGVAGASATVDVTAEGEILQTTQSQLRSDFTPQQVTQLPLGGGAIDQLALLVPGVLTPGDTNFTNGVGIAANGNRGRSNNFQIDGQDNNDNSVAGPTLTLTNTEAIGEFQVITNSFSAEFGRNSGAQINSITRAGTNHFRGSLFYFLQNSATNAPTNIENRDSAAFQFLTDNGFSQFSGLANRGKDPFTNNRVGGALGGPIFKNKAFFFLTYQRDRTRGETAVSNLATGGLTFETASAQLARALFNNPATAQLVSNAPGGGPAFVQGQGTFFIAPPVSDLDGDGVPDTFNYGPGNPFGNPVTTNRLAPSLYVCSTPTVTSCPAGNVVALFTGEGVRLVRNDNGADELITREDFNLSERDVLSVRYIFNKTDFPLATGRALAGALFDVPSLNHNIGTTYTRTLSPNFVNEARFNYSYLKVDFGDTSATPGPNIAFSGQRDVVGNFGSLAFGTPNNLPQSRKVATYQLQDTISATLGNHAVKFGADIRFQRTDNFFLPTYLGTYTFRGTSNAGTVPAGTFFNPDGSARTGAATAFENLLLNRPRDIAFAVGSPERKIDQDDYFFFVQDDWRVRSNLTLNLGLRYEISSQPFNPLIEEMNAREASASTSLFGTAFPLETRSLAKIPVDKNNFAPRVGFAWSPNFDFLGERFSNGRTVLRAGFGVAYDPGYFNIVNNTVTAAPFVGAGFIRQNNPAAPGSVGIPFLPNSVAALQTTPGTAGGDPRLFNQTRIADDFHNPYSISYNVGIQQELWKNTVLEVRYVGTLIRDQFQTVNGNPDLRSLALAGDYFGDPTLFTNGVAVTPYAGAGALVPTAANGFNTRGVDPNGNVRNNGSGRLDPNFGLVRLRNNGANGRYDGLQTEFRTRFTNLAVQANYTLSKTTDNASEIFSSLGGGQTVAGAQDVFDTDAGERGLSAFHQKHSFVANFVYDLPIYRNQKGFAGKLLGGYQLSGIVRLGSGRPYTPLLFFGAVDPNFDNAFFGTGTLRPFNGNANAPNGTIAFGSAAAAVIFGDERAAAGQYVIYNTAQPGSSGRVVSEREALQQARLVYNDFGLFSQFGVPLEALEAFNLFGKPYGDVGRNTFFGDNFYTVNASLAKKTRITERTSLEFRIEATNLFNQRNFGVPDPITEDALIPNAGLNNTVFVVGTFQNPGVNNGGSRNLRFGLRFLF